MSIVIAKRYAKALIESAETSEFELFNNALSGIASMFKNEKFKIILSLPELDASEKREIILAGVKNMKNKKLDNFISLLAENGRLDIIPLVAEEIRLEIAKKNNQYEGVIYSNQALKPEDIESLSKNLSARVGSNIQLKFQDSKFDGIKVEVEDLNIEVAFSKDSINRQLIEHILKAI